MPDLKEVIERLEGEARNYRMAAKNPYFPEDAAVLATGKAMGLERALSALKPLLEKNDD